MNQTHKDNQIKELEIIKMIPNLRALVVGDIMLDVYEFCNTVDSKPIDSEKLGKRAYKARKTIKTLGGAGNVAANLASLDVKTSLIGLTGQDENYFKICELANEKSIKHGLIQDANRPTTTKTRLYLDDEYLLRRDTEVTKKLGRKVCAKLLDEVFSLLPSTDVVVLSDYDKGIFTAESAKPIIKQCRLLGIPVIVDFKPVNKDLFYGVNIIAPNATEAAELIKDFSLKKLKSRCKNLHDLLGCLNTVVTLGEYGICGIESTKFFHIPGYDVVPADRAGCGDTVRAGLAIGAALGIPLRIAAKIANDAATIIVQKTGTSVLSRVELQSFILENEYQKRW